MPPTAQFRPNENLCGKMPTLMTKTGTYSQTLTLFLLSAALKQFRKLPNRVRVSNALDH